MAGNWIQTLLGSGGGSADSIRSSSMSPGRRRGARSGPLSDGWASGRDYQLIPLDEAQILIVICSDEEDWEKIDETIQLWDEKALTNSPELEKFAIEHGDPQIDRDHA